MSTRVRLQRLAIVAAAYFLGGYLGLLLPYVGSQITLIWPATGIAVAALVRWGLSLWPAIWFGAFSVNLVVGGSGAVAAGIAVGNTLAPVAAAWLLKRLDFRLSMERRRDIPAFFLAGALLPMLVSAGGGVLTLYLAGMLTAEQVPSAGLAWWLGDSLGVLLFGPPLFTFGLDRKRRAALRDPGFLAALAILLGSGVVLFSQAPPLVTLMLPLLPLVWLAMLRDTWTTSSAALGFAMIAVVGTAQGRGPFADEHADLSLAMLWTYLAGITLLNLLVTTLAAGYRQVEQALRERESRLAEAQRLAHLGSWELDLAANHLVWSAEIYRIFEIDPGQFDASYEAFLNAIHPDDREAVNRAYTDSLANRSPYEITHRLRMPDGRIKYVCERCQTYYASDGQPLRSVGTLQDITAQHLAEAELARHRQHLEDQVAERTRELRAARDAAETANRAKSVFLSNMSHELRTPLNAILGFAQLLAREHDLPARFRHNVDTINRSGRHLLGLINDVLEISRIEAGRVALRPTPFHLGESLATVEEMTRVRALAKGIGFRVLKAQDLPDCVEGDADRLRQVLLNLLSNAVKFTDAGEVVLSVETAGRDRLGFRVADQGPGIPEAERRRIFEPFYQTTLGVTRGEGAGLGLAISHEYVRLMGGELVLERRPEGGSVFRFEAHLPAVSQAQLQAEAHRRVTGLAEIEAVRRVLVVEDNDASRDLLEQMLGKAGFLVESARDGREAEALYLSWHPHFIWMDMRMPVMDGYEATRRIRALPGGAEVRIAALTASAFEEDRGAIFAAGCDELVAKPVDETQLFEVMARLLGIRYRYETADEPSPSPGAGQLAGLAELPEAQAAALAAAAEALDLERTRAILAEIAPAHPELAEALNTAIEGYRFDLVAQALARRGRTGPGATP